MRKDRSRHYVSVEHYLGVEQGIQMHPASLLTIVPANKCLPLF